MATALRKYTSSRKQKVGATAAALILVGASAAVAATITISVSQSGAGAGIVSSCDSTFDLALDTPVYNAALPGYEYQNVAYSNIDASCATQTLDVTVADSAEVALGTGSDTLDGTGTGTIALDVAVSVEDSSTVYGTIYE
jgi:hypothetical protein